MSADPIVYCLEHLSDYREFERFCSALLRGAGHTGIDPFGGTGDEGRDAVIRSDSEGRKVGFAYSVRSDWRTKLQQDANRLRTAGHTLDSLVFVTTQALRPMEKDWAHTYIQEEFNWTFDLWDLERIRVEIVGGQSHLIAQHPGIFAPAFFRQRGGQSVVQSRDTLLIDHVAADHALATWLARRLSLAGYRTWCLGTAPLAGEDADESVRQLMEARAALYLPIISPASLGDTAFCERCVLATARPDFVLPCCSSASPIGKVPSRLAKLTALDFDSSWKTGLTQLLAQLTAVGIKLSGDAERSRQIALRDYLPRPITVAKPEPVFANAFPLKVPESMLLIDLTRPLSDAEVMALRARWAFAILGPTQLAAFVPPPSEVIPIQQLNATPELRWDGSSRSDGGRAYKAAQELARRSLEVACAAKGLDFCLDRGVFYFPAKDGNEWNQPIRHVDGRHTTVQLNGDRTKGWGDRASPFHYQLAPRFRPQLETAGTSTMLVGVYVRVTEPNGTPYVDKEIGRRRKVVGKSWWNKEWLARVLGVVQALESREGVIEIGQGARAVVMQTQPLTWMSPVGLDVVALSEITDIGAELAAARAEEQDTEYDDEAQAAPEGGP